MEIRKLIEGLRKREGVNVAGGVNTAVDVGSGKRSGMSVKSRRRVVQRNGETLVDERSDEINRRGSE